MLRNTVLTDISLIEKLLQWLGIGVLEDGSVTSVFTVSTVIMSIAVILFGGFLMTRLTKLLKLPNVTAYILTGVIFGPILALITSTNGLIPQSVIDGTEFLSDIALAFIAFSAGEFFKVKDLKKAGWKVIIVTLFESLMAFALVFVLCAFILKIDMAFSLILAALSSATAPASTIMTIRQTKAKGEYVNTLLEVVALDDVITLILYSIAISVCLAINNGGNISFESVGWPIIENLICLALGFGCGFLLKLLLPKRRTTDNRLIIVIAVLFLFCGICSLFGQSPLLGCMAIGMVYTNMANQDEQKLFSQVNYFTPPIMLIFFVRSGLNFKLSAFASGGSIGSVPLILVALLYFVVRIIGKYGGAFLGSLVTRSDKKIRNYLGLGLIPQAGVAIGLAAMGARILTSNGSAYGDYLNTIILASSVLYELIGPGCSKLGLFLSKSYSTNIDEIAPVEDVAKEEKKNDVDVLIAQIKHIQENLPDITPIEEEENAFNEAAEEYESEYTSRNYRRFINTNKK